MSPTPTPHEPGLSQVLDPKLRRLVHDLKSKESTRLRADVDSAFLSSSVILKADQLPDPKDLFKRVLVKLDRDEIPAPMAGLSWSRIVDEIYSVNVPVNRLDDLAATPGVQFVSAGHQVGVDLDTSRVEVKADVAQAPPPDGHGLSGEGVVIGIVDFGCDFRLADFREEDGKSTRIKFLWDQSLKPTGKEKPPEGFPHGVEYTHTDIDFTNGVIPASESTRKVRHAPERSSHGTHVMGIAAGNGATADAAFPAGRFVGMAPKATIIFVHPAANDQKTSFTDSVHVAEAVAYIFRKARELGLPCVINMSLGQNGGSHDGESIVERAIDRLLEEPGRAFVVAGGNEHLWSPHASGAIQAGETRSLGWRVGGPLPAPFPSTLNPGPDRTPNEMEIWYSSRDRFEVRVIDPDGHATDFLAPNGQPIIHPMPGGNRVFIDSERFTTLNGDARIYIEVHPAATAAVHPGDWRVEIRGAEVRHGRFDAWIERDLRDMGNHFGDQSTFVPANVDPTMTLSTPATTRRAIAVANYRHSPSVSISVSSGRGTTRDGRPKPEVAAPGTDIRSSNSGSQQPSPAPGTTSNPARVSMTGTSQAAPHVAGIVALLLSKEASLTAAQIGKLLIASARPFPGGPGFDPAFGFGLVDAAAAIRLLS
ncbi:S8 family peptidase [Aquisphaera insulae]|uniref:S8 family peptidase n=1 Tax=Aquisphaera insulae TaxID=2712864 RepID=UPI0013E9B2E8|nr:S8 family peptidase [Aquisphaera insulae]